MALTCVSAPLFDSKFVAVKVQMIANISRRKLRVAPLKLLTHSQTSQIACKDPGGYVNVLRVRTPAEPGVLTHSQTSQAACKDPGAVATFACKDPGAVRT